jgi:cystathionine gamma-synthase
MSLVQLVVVALAGNAIMNMMMPPRRPYLLAVSALTPPEAGHLAQSLARQLSRTSPPVVGADTLLAHAGIDTTLPNAPMAPPLDLATTYGRRADGYDDVADDYIYARGDNPTRHRLEREIGRLEIVGHNAAVAGSGSSSSNIAAEENYDEFLEEPVTPCCCAFASGMMAASSVLLAHGAPLHVLMPIDLYHGVSTVLLDVFARFGVTAIHVDMSDLGQVKEAVVSVPSNEDVIVWLETPSNPLIQVLDIRAVAKCARTVRANVTVLVDSTLAPPAVISQPLLHGADLVLHSATKYLAGHSDALLGVVTASPFTNRGVWIGQQLRTVQVAVGGVAAPFDCWLTLRGLRTLPVRVARQSETALKLARFLKARPDVIAVHYPGLGDHPSHNVAKRQMKVFGGVLSVEVADELSAWALAGALRTIQRATSLGGTETLIEHRASIEPAGRVVSPPGLLRISVGLEDPDDLMADLASALAIMKQVCTSSRSAIAK